MGEDLIVEFPRVTPQSSVSLLNTVYRYALMGVGHSPDFHLYDLDRIYLRHKGNASAVFLLRVLDFYSFDLDDMERRIFICDCLERGRHYPWWYYEFLPTRFYSVRRRTVYQKVVSHF